MSRSALPGRDPYQVLGVAAGASREDIVRAYRRAAHAAHPDARPADPEAAARFRALTDAYDLLSDPGRRADYDRRHPSAPPAVPRPPAWPRPVPASPPAPPLRVGPVRIDPPPGMAHPWAGPPGWPGDDEADLAALLGWYLRRAWGWPR
jgi:curved DNA-binding protein CbpA